MVLGSKIFLGGFAPISKILAYFLVFGPNFNLFLAWTLRLKFATLAHTTLQKQPFFTAANNAQLGGGRPPLLPSRRGGDPSGPQARIHRISTREWGGEGEIKDKRLVKTCIKLTAN